MYLGNRPRFHGPRNQPGLPREGFSVLYMDAEPAVISRRAFEFSEGLPVFRRRPVEQPRGRVGSLRALKIASHAGLNR